MNTTLPPPEHFEYFSHLFHSNSLIPFDKYIPLANSKYSDSDKHKFEKLFLTNPTYFQNLRILDLGCHCGYLSYISKYLGATSVHGINARSFPLDVANYAFSQLNISNYKFEQGDIEDLEFLKEVCKNKDTLILSQTLEHLRNPYAILEIISKSNIKNIILLSAVFSDEGEPAVKYYRQSVESNFTVYEKNKQSSIGSVPNVPWFDMVLYHLGWQIEHHSVDRVFNNNWFATPNLTKFVPFTFKELFVLCKKFNNDDINNFEN